MSPGLHLMSIHETYDIPTSVLRKSPFISWEQYNGYVYAGLVPKNR